MQEVKIEKCPFCGREELIECRIDSNGGVWVAHKVNKFYHSVQLYATVCRDCGSVIRTYCKEPEKLFPKKERRE